MAPPLILHSIFQLARAGLESNLVRLINHMPPERYRHAIVCLQGYTDFRHEIRRPNVEVYDLGHHGGVDFRVFYRIYELCRRLRPAIFHSRNLPTVDGQWPAWLARVPARIHSEEGRDISDPLGLNRKYNLLRRAARPIVHEFSAVSQDLCHWLVERIGVPPAHVAFTRNGVDTAVFRPRSANEPRPAIGPSGWLVPGALVYGWLGRITGVKDPLNFLEAFRQVAARQASTAGRPVRLLMIGSGEERVRCLDWVQGNGIAPLCWIPGATGAVQALPSAAEALRLMDVFVLSSIAEGTPVAVLEAMASGLPVVATRVGGLPQLVDDGAEGWLVPPGDPSALAESMVRYASDPALLQDHGCRARKRVELEFSISAMVGDYLALYDKALRRAPAQTRT